MNDPTKQDETVRSVISRDGTRIGFRQSGGGPALVLIHGAMQSGANFRRLAAALADRFTIIVPDRRGRGLSGPFGSGYGIRAEVEDLTAVLHETGARDVFGLSSGAIVALETALVLPALQRLALYEPPLTVSGAQSSIFWAPRYERELASGNTAAAMVTVLKGTGDRTLFTRIPRFVLTPLFRRALRQGWAGAEGGPPLRDLIPTVRFDAGLVEETSSHLPTFADIRAATLLLGGTQSAAFLPAALGALAGVIPGAQRVELRGVGHIAADNNGKPERVAAELRRWFSPR